MAQKALPLTVLRMEVVGQQKVVVTFSDGHQAIFQAFLAHGNISGIAKIDLTCNGRKVAVFHGITNHYMTRDDYHVWLESGYTQAHLAKYWQHAIIFLGQKPRFWGKRRFERDLTLGVAAEIIMFQAYPGATFLNEGRCLPMDHPGSK